MTRRLVWSMATRVFDVGKVKSSIAFVVLAQCIRAIPITPTDRLSDIYYVHVYLVKDHSFSFAHLHLCDYITLEH